MTSDEIRKKYTDYFEKNNHKLIRSSSLIPNNDPTLLFTNSGMVQFKRIFLGEEKRSYNRATSSQKCVRAGGKHNDLENVGHTARHHTFFEMLGNFSFGDYFKQEAIEFAWDLITNVYKLPSDKLWASIHIDDDESYRLWQHNIGLPDTRIVCLGNEENFWSMGDTGPCGPCSELYMDRGKHFGCRTTECNVNCNCDRFIEIWNLVFMQFNRDKLGNMIPLPKPSIDTGLGLERLASIIQNVGTNFETDLILPIINRTENLSNIKYGYKKKYDVAMKVISDHSRAIAFLIADGVLPSNEGRGYVLRRIMRRAIRYGRTLKLHEPFLHYTAQIVFDIMGQAYPELRNSAAYITKIVKNEEIKFSSTIDNGLKILNEGLEEISCKGKNNIPGDLIFKLYDTYGFPVDIIRDIAKDKGMLLDLDSFHTNMHKQRERSYSKKQFVNISESYGKIFSKNLKSEFVGYDSLSIKAKVLLIVANGIEVTTAANGTEIEIMTDRTPLYGEAGGQMGDKGNISDNGLDITIKNTVRTPSGIIMQQGVIVSGNLEVGQQVSIFVNRNERLSLSRNHTATHILHSVLRRKIGEYVKQAGSLVAAGKLRFDFTNSSGISKKQLSEIENQVNKQIINNMPITTVEVPIEEATKSGAIALFEEKYEDQVRVVNIGTFSKELCGGTHVKFTGEIGLFTIISEYGIASGVRRIEATTGSYALKHVQKLRKIVENTASHLKIPSSDILEKIVNIKRVNKLLEKKVGKFTTENAILKMKLSGEAYDGTHGKSSALIKSEVINGIKVKIDRVEINTANDLRAMIDNLKNEIKSGIVALGCEQNGKALLIVGVTKDLTKKFNANSIIKKMAEVIGGKGGGRSDMAQAGGTKPQNINQALEKLKTLVTNS